jgi:hypothetical protein
MDIEASSVHSGVRRVVEHPGESQLALAGLKPGSSRPGCGLPGRFAGALEDEVGVGPELAGHRERDRSDAVLDRCRRRKREAGDPLCETSRRNHRSRRRPARDWSSRSAPRRLRRRSSPLNITSRARPRPIRRERCCMAPPPGTRPKPIGLAEQRRVARSEPHVANEHELAAQRRGRETRFARSGRGGSC